MLLTVMIEAIVTPGVSSVAARAGTLIYHNSTTVLQPYVSKQGSPPMAAIIGLATFGA